MKPEAIFSKSCEYKYTQGVYDFLGHDDYSESFGFQWTKFQKTQFDSYSKLSLTEDRLFSDTQWEKSELEGAKVLEAGSGAGRFTEILLKYRSDLVTFDLSKAVFANTNNNAQKGRAIFCRASIYDLPFQKESFDKVFCFGVLQHTPDPDQAFKCLWEMVKPGGKMSIDYYKKRLIPKAYYFWRPFTKRLSNQSLFKIVKWYVPKWLRVDTLLRKHIPFGYYIARTPIPVCNYYFLNLSDEAKVNWGILDTFDNLSPSYDKPKSKKQMQKMISAIGHVESARLAKGANGWVVNLVKKPEVGEAVIGAM